MNDTQPKPTGDTTAFTHDALPEDFEPDQPKPTGEKFKDPGEGWALRQHKPTGETTELVAIGSNRELPNDAEFAPAIATEIDTGVSSETIDLPKPTGEWTAEYVSELALKLGNASKNVADAHNAALAALQEKVQTLVDLALAIEPHINRLNAALAKVGTYPLPDGRTK